MIFTESDSVASVGDVHYDFSVNDPTINTEGNNSNSNHLLPPLLKLATSPTMTPTFEKHFYLSSNNLHVVLEMVAILGIILEYFIKQFQGILNLVINSCNVDIVMQKCGIMKAY